MHGDKIAKQIATLGFIGFMPIAPGTFGTFAALTVFLLLKPSLHLLSVILFLIIPVGIISSHIAERVLNEKDSRHIIIDEFCGYFLSVLFVPVSFGYALAAFFLFRVFDILKPFPIRKTEKLKGGLGIMADDLMAALYTNVMLQIWIFIHQH
jgi:phosphatidylglycerophosphatase A